MGYARYPCRKLAVLGVAAQTDGLDRLHKCFLKNIVRYVLVFYNPQKILS